MIDCEFAKESTINQLLSIVYIVSPTLYYTLYCIATLYYTVHHLWILLIYI